MKKIFISALLAVIVLDVYAQTDSRHRTPKTIVQDVLAIVPCNDTVTFNSEFGALAAAAPETVLMLSDMLGEPGTALRPRVEYALGGLAAYASGREGAGTRAAVVKGFRKAIAATDDDAAKLFLSLQLKIVLAGSGTAAAKLAPGYTVVKAPVVSDRKFARMSEEEKADVLYWTGESRDSSRIDFVLAGISSPSAVVAQEAVVAAGKIGTPVAAEALIGALEREDIDAVPSLRSFNGDILPVLRDAYAACPAGSVSAAKLSSLLASFEYVAPETTPVADPLPVYDSEGKLVEVYHTVLSDEEKADGFYLLFDGTDMSQWEGALDGYKPLNGCIDVDCQFGGNLYTRKEYRNFIFRFEFRFLQPAVNNGVGIRTPEGVDAAYDGMCEVQILDHDDPCYSWLNKYQVHGSVYGVIPAKRIVHKPLGEWSTEEIVVNGENIKVTVNGEVILEGNVREACQGHNVAPDGSGENPYTADHSNHPGLFNEKGHISFCGHGSGLQFRNIRIKEL